MRASPPLGLTVALLTVAGCGARERPFPPLCGSGPGPVLKALARAPAAVRLPDGTRLSECVARARTDADLQELGFALVPAAHRLQERGTPAAALQLGYLVGAVRRGAARSNGIQAELQRKLERTLPGDARLVDAAQRGANAGVRAG